MAAHEEAQNGWTAVPCDANQLFNGKTFENPPRRLLVADVEWPSNDPIVVQVQQYAKDKLPLPTYHHSMRVFYFGKLIFLLYHCLIYTLRHSSQSPNEIVGLSCHHH